MSALPIVRLGTVKQVERFQEHVRSLGLTIPCDRELLTGMRSEEHTSELQSRLHLVCRLLLEKKNPEPFQQLGDAGHEPDQQPHREAEQRVIPHEPQVWRAPHSTSDVHPAILSRRRKSARMPP